MLSREEKDAYRMPMSLVMATAAALPVGAAAESNRRTSDNYCQRRLLNSSQGRYDVEGRTPAQN
jgi:hypothetical protein